MRLLRVLLDTAWVWVVAIPPVALISICIAVLLTGCAEMTDTPWIKRHEPLPVIAISLVDDVDAACRERHAVFAGRIYGCAMRDFRSQVCIIFLPRNYPQWLLDHERRHCLTGEDHE